GSNQRSISCLRPNAEGRDASEAQWPTVRRTAPAAKCGLRALIDETDCTNPWAANKSRWHGTVAPLSASRLPLMKGDRKSDLSEVGGHLSHRFMPRQQSAHSKGQ